MQKKMYDNYATGWMPARRLGITCAVPVYPVIEKRRGLLVGYEKNNNE